MFERGRNARVPQRRHGWRAASTKAVKCSVVQTEAHARDVRMGIRLAMPLFAIEERVHAKSVEKVDGKHARTLLWLLVNQHTTRFGLSYLKNQ